MDFFFFFPSALKLHAACGMKWEPEKRSCPNDRAWGGNSGQGEVCLTAGPL